MSDLKNTQKCIETSKRISDVLLSKNITKTKILSDCKLGENTLSKMAKGGDVLSQNLVKIADYLEVSVDYLLGNEKQPTQMGELSEDETALLDAFRALNEEGQEKITDYASDLVALGKYKKCGVFEMGDNA